jgi:phage gpG-like protein
MTDVTLKMDGLEKLLKALKDKAPTIRVGILGNSNARSTKGPNNATIGAYHEFGTTKMPQRSFLRIPISDNLQKEMESSGALDKDVLRAVMASGSLVPWAKKVAVLAEGIVAEAFATGGFGKWKPSNMSYKANHQTLVETQQLRNSITSEVK